MKRGDIVTVAAKGRFTSKPRPAVIVSSDFFEGHSSVAVVLLTGEVRDIPMLRWTVEPSAQNGLKKASQVQIDKITAVAVEDVGEPIGQLSTEDMTEITRYLATYLGVK
ncbi:type II toxin-antitoxin system PemK/MazF family toxin (plasmid) [Cupriavidus pauculus]|uniref:Type II toxin-antitoxin system PemK/MazF family toxin n=1 Tax=Cupriavidus pauculus TaxID=82633 RepID=A0A5P2H8V5_9BURK|nr:type II toxin-antitoxin system PemK/MazF family toxin [Cupriavidus pauculus]QET04044.1 type II toxin-antitoxin system PemK/MazF family toxin [Cupriavidus pauculus]